LVEASAVEQFKEQVAKAYTEATGRVAKIYACRASDGVGRAVPE
jgi:galactokinase